MQFDPPHLYRIEGRARGVADPVIDASLASVDALKISGVAPVLTLKHLAQQTGLSYGFLRSVVERQLDPYEEFTRTRRGGGPMRIISAPEPRLMHLQRWILTRILNPVPQHSASFAYQHGRSAVDAASRHVGAHWILKFDLHDFYGSIDERQAYKVFGGLGFSPLPAFELARLCTRLSPRLRRPSSQNTTDYVIDAYSTMAMGVLPQGGPTSGALANLVARQLDDRLQAFANEKRYTYTRYADDLVFSSVEPFSRDSAASSITEVRRTIQRCRFTMHEKKTKVVPPGGRQIVLGVVVTRDGLQLRREVKSGLHAHVRGVEKFGVMAHAQHRGFRSVFGLLHHVLGMLSYADQVEPEFVAPLKRRWTAATGHLYLDV
jgi:RNA-directed DNA polymerase